LQALDEAYMRVQTSGDDVATDTTLESMNALSGAGGGDTFPEHLVSVDLVGQCSMFPESSLNGAACVYGTDGIVLNVP
jgi:hypothetical protein